MQTEVSVTKWEIKDILTKKDLIRFQIAVYCHFEKIHLSSARLECLTLLGYTGSAELYYFCEQLIENGIFQSMQSSRNELTWLEKRNLIEKERIDKKKFIKVHPDLQVVNKGNVKLCIDFLSPIKEPVETL